MPVAIKPVIEDLPQHVEQIAIGEKDIVAFGRRHRRANTPMRKIGAAPNRVWCAIGGYRMFMRRPSPVRSGSRVRRAA